MGLGFPWGLWLLADALSNVGLLRLNGGSGAFGEPVVSAGVAAVEDEPEQKNGKGYRQQSPA